jgi:CPA2 family monovalent cation:H+ antiporter-2
MENTLQLVLLLLGTAVLVVIVFRQLKLPAMLGYLLVGVVIGPYGLAWIPDTEHTRDLAEFGVVFLMFSIGLEFSLGKLATMRRIVFGLGTSQVALTLALVIAGAVALGVGWRSGLVIAGAVAMSSTAIVTKMLADQLELNTLHGRQVIGVLLFQDLAVVPLLILVPALAQDPADLAPGLAVALLKAAFVLSILLYFGQRPMRAWFHLVARQKSSELFVLNVLLITLGVAYLTDLAGLSLALGAFVAGMLISETEYRYQVEDDIKPFRDVLLGLFFVTVGMKLNSGVVLENVGWVAATVTALIALKTLLIAGLSRAFGADTGAALRTGLDLAHGGEFGFVLLTLAAPLDLVSPTVLQILLAAMVISMLAAPFLIERSENIARHFSGAEWMARAMDITRIASQSMSADNHVVICGYGRSGQSLARLLEREGISCIALDNDTARVREAAAAGESVVFGDATRREVLIAAGLLRAKALVVSVADTALALRVLSQVQQTRAGLPVIVRTHDESDLERLRAALNRVLRGIRISREQRYGLLRGFFRGASDEADVEDQDQPRLHSIAIEAGSAAIGRTLAELDLASLRVEVKSVRRRKSRAVAPDPAARLEEGDVLVVLGPEPAFRAVEMRVMQGRGRS